MRCKKHVTDHSSSIGVCASCLRDRLFVIIAAQVQEDRHRRTDNNIITNPPLQFPRSVSPYISRRKSDGFKIDTWQNQQRQEGGDHDQRFFSTPHVGPSGKIVVDGVSKKKSGFGFSLSAVAFRSKPEKPDLDDVSGSDPDRNDMVTSTTSRWWFVRMIFGRRRKKTRTLSVDEPGVGRERKACRKDEKGMSPVRNSDEDENWNHELSGSLSEWKETPKRTPVWIPPGKRGGHNRNGSGFGICLSPLVRASPSRQWNQKGVSSELVVSGDMRVVPVKPSPSHPSAFCKNRSKKMADFGRCHLNH